MDARRSDADRADDDVEPELDDERLGARAELLAEERVAGSDDPEAQAAAILADADRRQLERDVDPDPDVERRTSDEATHPVD